MPSRARPDLAQPRPATPGHAPVLLALLRWAIPLERRQLPLRPHHLEELRAYFHVTPKTILLGKFPFKIQAGLEYSVVSPDLFGKRANFRILVPPVIPGLVKKPIFGGG